MSRARATVLLGWELGGGFGHAAGLIDVATRLADRGMTPVLALRDLPGSWPIVGRTNFSVLPASVPPFLAPAGYRARSFSDVLVAHGFADPTILLPVLRGWDGVIAAIRPDLVICDHAPALCLAVGGRLPVVRVGNGFTVPPCEDSSFPLLTSSPALLDDGTLAEKITIALAERGGPAPDPLPSAFAGTAEVVSVFPDLDPYQATRTYAAIGPLRRPSGPLAAPPTDRFFAYLAAEDPGTEIILRALVSHLPGSAYVRGITAGGRGALEASGVQVLSSPPSLSDAMAGCTVAVHHGSLGAAQAAASAGRPQMCFPRHLEHRITAMRLERLGVGLLPREPTAEHIQDALPRLADTQANASAVAAYLDGLKYDGSVSRIIDSCIGLVDLPG